MFDWKTSRTRPTHQPITRATDLAALRPRTPDWQWEHPTTVGLYVFAAQVIGLCWLIIVPSAVVAVGLISLIRAALG